MGLSEIFQRIECGDIVRLNAKHPNASEYEMMIIGRFPNVKKWNINDGKTVCFAKRTANQEFEEFALG